MGNIEATKLKLGNRVTDPKPCRECAMRGVMSGSRVEWDRVDLSAASIYR